jgi:hypothetical protein
MDDKDMRSRTPGSKPADGNRWSSDPSTVERRDLDRPETGADAYADADIVNRTGKGLRTPRRYEAPDVEEKG